MPGGMNRETMSAEGDPLALDDALVREGDAWVLRITSGAATQADADALRRWRGMSPAHECAFREAARMRRLVRYAAHELREQQCKPALKIVAANDILPQHVNRRAVLRGAIAASVAGTAMFAGGQVAGLWFSPSAKAAYVTRKGERRTVMLRQGVSAELNTQTSIALRPALGAAGIELLSGEVVLTVEESAVEPLIVLAGEGRATASRARFSIRCDGAVTDVICLDGRVAVQVHGKTRQVISGNKLVYDQDGMGVPIPVDTAAATAWSKGMLVFRQKPLGHVVAEINRYRAGRILLVDQSLAKRRIDGTFYIDRIDDIFDQLHSAFGARVTRLPGGVVILT